MIEVKFRPDHTYESPSGRILPGISMVMDAARINYEFEGGFASTEKGSRIHQAVHYACEGDLDPESVRPEERGYIEASRKAIKDLGIKILHAEWAVGNESLGYATKLDVYGNWHGKPVCLNWKTSSTVYRCYAIQSALEALLFTPDPVERLGIHLKKDGTYKPVHYVDRSDFTVAKAALTVLAWQKGAVK